MPWRVWGLLVCVASACAKPLPCLPECDGCCDPNNDCVPATDEQCGQRGGACVSCAAPNHCFAGVCAARPNLVSVDLTWTIRNQTCATATEREGAIRFTAGVPPDFTELDCTLPTQRLSIELPAGQTRSLLARGHDADGGVVLAGTTWVRSNTPRVDVDLGPSNGTTGRARLQFAPFPDREGVPFCQWLGVTGFAVSVVGGSTTTNIEVPCLGTTAFDHQPGLLYARPVSPFLSSNLLSTFSISHVGAETNVLVAGLPRVTGVAVDWEFSGPVPTNCGNSNVSSISLTSREPSNSFDASVPCEPLFDERFIEGAYVARALWTDDSGTREFSAQCHLGATPGTFVRLDAGVQQVCTLREQ